MSRLKLSSKTNGIMLSYVHFALNAILSIVLSSFVLRVIGKTNYGVYQSMTAFITYLVLLEFGMSTLMTRNISLLKKDGTDSIDVNKNVSTIWTATIILAAIMFALLVSFYFLIPSIYSNSFTNEQIVLGKRIFIFAGINLVTTFLTSTLNGLVLAYEKYIFEKLLGTIKLILRSILIIALLSIRADIMLLVIVDFSLGLLVFTITLLYCLFKFKAKLTFKYFDKTIIRFAAPLAIAMLIQGLVNTANTVVDKFLISIMMTPEDVSIYSITMLIFNMYSSVGTLPNTLFIPSIAKNVKNNIVGHEFTKTLVQPCRLNVIISGVIGFGFILVGRQFITLVYGADYLESWLYSLVIIIPLFFYLTNAIMAHVLTLYNKRQMMAYITLVATAINIGLTIFAIKWIGMFGAAMATAVSITIQIISLNIYYKKRIGISIFYLFKEAYKGIIPALALSFAFVFPIIQRIPRNLYSFLIGGSLFVVLFLTSFVLFGANQKEKEFINKLKKRFGKPKHQEKNKNESSVD
ncbi:MAG: polysaccharide biosynthesis C-terminal domain-containing protein [Bacilli bacterium]|nr:polysaccharide biosynthesis C-terminal domain-containing protein [Bacilli bacterium]